MNIEGRGGLLKWERLGRFGAHTAEVCGVPLGAALLNAGLPAGRQLIYERRGGCRDDEKKD